MYTSTHIIDQSVDVIGVTMYIVMRCMVILCLWPWCWWWFVWSWF